MLQLWACSSLSWPKCPGVLCADTCSFYGLLPPWLKARAVVEFQELYLAPRPYPVQKFHKGKRERNILKNWTPCLGYICRSTAIFENLIHREFRRETSLLPTKGILICSVFPSNWMPVPVSFLNREENVWSSLSLQRVVSIRFGCTWLRIFSLFSSWAFKMQRCLSIWLIFKLELIQAKGALKIKLMLSGQGQKR